MRTMDLYKQEVLRLENKQKSEMTLLKQEIHAGYEYIQPINILKRTLAKAAKSPEIKGDLLMIAVDTVTSFLTNKVIAGKTSSPLRNWIASFLQSTVHNFVGKHGDKIKIVVEQAALNVLNKISKKKTTSQTGKEDDIASHHSKSAA